MNVKKLCRLLLSFLKIFVALTNFLLKHCRDKEFSSQALSQQGIFFSKLVAYGWNWSGKIIKIDREKSGNLNVVDTLFSDSLN